MRSIEIDQENSEAEILELLTQNGDDYYLQGPARGVALQVLSRGRDSLTNKQEYVFQKHVADKYFHMECGRCHIPMPTCEVPAAIAECDDLCGWCRHMQSKYY